MSCFYSGLPLCIDTEDLTTRSSISTMSVQISTQASHLTSGANSVHCVFILEWYWNFYFYLKFIESWQIFYVCFCAFTVLIMLYLWQLVLIFNSNSGHTPTLTANSALLLIPRNMLFAFYLYNNQHNVLLSKTLHSWSHLWQLIFVLRLGFGES